MTTPDPSANVYKLVKQAIKGVYNMMSALEKRVIEKLDSESKHSADLRDAMKEGSRADIQSAVTRAEALAKQQEELVKRISAIEVAQSQDHGKSSIWSNPLVLIVISALIGFILAKYFK